MTTIAWGWQDPEDFVRDMKTYKAEDVSDVTDLSGAKIRWAQLEKELQEEKDKVFQESIKPVGSNGNWGRITQSEELQGTTLSELGIDIQTDFSRFKTQSIYSNQDALTFYNQNFLNRILERGELTAPLANSIDEGCENEMITDTKFFCKGCSKYFATKASLKRHHDRKKSCKDLCEKQDISGAHIDVPDKPYIVDWVDQLLTKSISGGQTEKPYCKHCDVEFANKANLNKHLSKSIACDKLAKQEFQNLLQTNPYGDFLMVGSLPNSH